jgi:sugar phosphate isomerase/epimerase
VRAIEAIGTGNCGINFDTANLILYGNGDALDALEMFGKYVLDTHIKDGLYPTDGKKLGREVKVGEGMANIPEVIKRLQSVGYKGNYIIEREISGEEQTRDILDTVKLLREILNFSKIRP